VALSLAGVCAEKLRLLREVSKKLDTHVGATGALTVFAGVGQHELWCKARDRAAQTSDEAGPPCELIRSTSAPIGAASIPTPS